MARRTDQLTTRSSETVGSANYYQQDDIGRSGVDDMVPRPGSSAADRRGTIPGGNV